MTFWILISLMALMIAALLGLTMLRGRRNGEPAAAYDLRVYREQLASVDRDLARGVIAEADAERVRTEISRRILAADAQIQQERDGGGPTRAVTIVVAVLSALILTGGGVLLYDRLGAPGYGDLPLTLRIEMAEEFRKDRPDQLTAEDKLPVQPKPEIDDSYANLLRQLRETVAGRPDDIQGHNLLAQHEANVGDFKAAYQAKDRAIELMGDAATADDFGDKAELMIQAAGGYVSPEAEAVLLQALDIDPANGPARYYWGQMLTQVGRPDLAFSLWEETLRISSPHAPWSQAIRAQIEDLAYRAGVNYTPPASPAPLSGPTGDDVDAASEMTAEERQDMIRGMVENLSDRLATEGGAPEEWARLITALSVLGEADRAVAIRDEALSVFAENDAAREMIANAARQAGLGE